MRFAVRKSEFCEICVSVVNVIVLVENKMAESHVSIEKLNDQNFTIWKFKMQLLLSREKVLKVVMEPAPTAPDASWSANDEKARALIGLALDDSQLIHVMQTNTSNEMWDV